MKVLIGPIEVAGVAAGLKYGFDRIGVASELILSQPHPFAYQDARAVPWLSRIWMTIGRRIATSPRPLNLFAWLAWKAWGFLVCFWALRRFDGFIFLFGSTFTNSAFEAWLYSRFRKKVVIVFCGSDARPPYIDGHVCQDPQQASPDRLERLARRARGRIERFERLGFVCVNNPCTAQFHARPFVNWFDIGLPRAVGDLPPPGPVGKSPTESRRAVRIVHSPSNPRTKGTDRIRAIVEKLSGEGLAIELILLQGLNNAEVMARLADCDFVIDQSWSDSPMAAFAVEAAHFGKPTVVSGYAASLAEAGLHAMDRIPSLFVRPDELEAAVRKLVVDEDHRHQLGERARRFVTEDWAPANVAARYAALLRGGPAYRIDPSGLHYVHGYAMPEAVARSTIRTLVEARGKEALQLGHNPALEAAFLNFAQGADR